ncbi:MAG: DUF1848 domain-containing protein [Promethearchaeota archaeon]
MRQVISFSRRTDGPAFYFDRFAAWVDRGHATVENPVNRRRGRVSLAPGDVAGFVFWSKDFGPMLDKWDALRPYERRPGLTARRVQVPAFFQFTRNAPNATLEPSSPSLDESFSQLRQLVELTSPDHVNWRFDPVVFWRDEDGQVKNNAGGFAEIADQFAEVGVKRCTFSFATLYRKVRRRMSAAGFRVHDPTPAERMRVARKVASAAARRGIRVSACCDPALARVPGVERASCVDGALLGRLWGERVSTARDAGQRADCRCTRSRDLGGYGPEWRCRHACLYCYANPAWARRGIY